MNPETDIICLEIVKGIPKAPGDTESAEEEMVTLNLLDPDGFGVLVDGWTPAFPGIKRGGTWAESQLADGRTLIAAGKDNVTETIGLAIGNADLKQRFQLLGKLNQLLDNARAFWEGGQIEPVYLKFKAACASVYQYALIYNGSIAQDTDPFDTLNAWSLTLVIEREPAWRMVVPPGGNPLEYWFWSQEKIRGVDYTFADLKLGNNTDHFAYGEVDNALEWNGPDYTTFHSIPWIDIDGSKIPGDAPALMYIAYEIGPPWINQLYVFRDTTPRTRYDRIHDINRYHHNILITGDATTKGSQTIDTCGLLCRDQLINRYITTYTIAASSTVEDVLYWQASADVNMLLNMMQGSWAVFLRAWQTNGALGDVTVTARIYLGHEVYGAIKWQSNPATIPFQTAATTNCQEFDIAYLGRLDLQPHQTAMASPNGYGMQIDSSDAWYVRIDCTNSAGATRNLEFLDLWFMRTDEGFCLANAADNAARGVYNGGDAGVLVIDNTGYTLHGRTDDACVRANVTGLFTGGGHINTIPLVGSALTLTPGVDNRLVFLERNIDFSPTEGTWSQVNSLGGPVRINIVPRCYGIADL